MSEKREAPRFGLHMSPVQILLLVKLEASPSYGYELLKAIKDAFEGVWEPKTGTIYPSLRSLEKQGLVATKEKEGVDFYHVTEKGRQFLRQVGQHQEKNMAFTTRFLTTILKWMSPELKRDLAMTFINISSENSAIGGMAFIKLLNGEFDAETRLSLLRSMRANMSRRFEIIDQMIREMEA
jgi:DNA-binding PadR family transcriptional regulator